VSEWECPICGNMEYSECNLHTDWGVELFYRCEFCTVMFRNPVHFSKLGIKSAHDSATKPTEQKGGD